MEAFKLTAAELSVLLEKRELSAEELCKSVFSRIHDVEDRVEAYLTLTEEQALAAARRVDERRAAGDKLSKLAGIPIAIKDNICTEGTLTTCASKMLYNFVPPYSATAYQKVLAQDMVPLGKVNMDEFAMGSSCENSHFKKTKNPHDLTRVPGGSSGGSAAAVAACEAVLALGSDTGGSIRQPASLCGIVGLKPTYGAVSRYGLIAFASSLDQIGPMGRSVEDVAMLYNAIIGADPMDATSEGAAQVERLNEDVSGLRIGLPRDFFGDGIDPEVRDMVLGAAKRYEQLGAKVDEVSIPMSEYALPTYYIISSAEASSNLARFDGVKYGFRAEHYEDLVDLYFKTRTQGFGDEVKRRIMLGTYVLSSGYYDAYYKRAQKVRRKLIESYQNAFDRFDVLLTPATPTTAFRLGEKTDDPIAMYMADICTISINIAELPAMVIPGGMDKNGLPVGIQLIGSKFSEPTLLSAAYGFEKNTGIGFVQPKL
ncbi:Asp-tRNA(Asn)/Glu-tRNA(Gln) amidotransferase subunit GatA [Feifania hominis]|uniref:Glutamyl-tRNA(Gln) amidotransferase subunit A n=1 Tax=Feifania hominis TaxID=2763660 RepID=A0A926HPR0_9FIRM|nr:Asp-tRNA(Asn)/Glu-tRNA(Gln) amidotransferase subunit GatA [Feifania hominis]MBC8535532.1 Asp-tRNA(Asn)/Glu-tRNA(Gln) amidotransferase subunit GatA [Feifania hominis]